MMTLEVLSSGESMALCRAAAGMALSRFRTLAQQARDGDRKLSELFLELAGDVERNLAEMDQLAGQSPSTEAAKAARGFLPTLSKGGEGSRLDRESGFYLVECILEELAGFYGMLARQSCDEPSRDLLQRSALAAKSRLIFLHHVVL
jgi:hypothetical protein